MMLTRLLGVFLTLLLLGIPLVATAGSGDPRLVNGVVDWPAVVTNEPFVIVRGDDGVLYYVGIAAARRDGAVTAGGRVSVLGLEGRSPYEITAVGIGSGATAEAALAQLQGVRPPAPVTPVASASPTPAAPTPTAAPATSPVRRPDAPSPKSATTDARASTTGARPAVVPASTPPPAEIATAQPLIPATSPMLVPTDDHRWIEIVGEVETLVGRTLVLKVDGGRVSVDVSSLRANLERIVAPGSMVKIYGVPVELRFKAIGFIDPDVRAHAPRPN